MCGTLIVIQILTQMQCQYNFFHSHQLLQKMQYTIRNHASKCQLLAILYQLSLTHTGKLGKQQKLKQIDSITKCNYYILQKKTTFSVKIMMQIKQPDKGLNCRSI